MNRIDSRPRIWLLIAIDWVLIVLLLVRIATGANFNWDGLLYSYRTNPGLVIMLVAAVALSLYVAWRLSWRPSPRSAWLSGMWAMAMTVGGVLLWSLGHGSAPAIIALALLAGAMSVEARSSRGV